MQSPRHVQEAAFTKARDKSQSDRRVTEPISLGIAGSNKNKHKRFDQSQTTGGVPYIPPFWLFTSVNIQRQAENYQHNKGTAVGKVK